MLTPAARAVAVVRRGGCSFLAKALAAQARGFGGLLVVDLTADTAAADAAAAADNAVAGSAPLAPPMVADGPGDGGGGAVAIPVFLVRGGGGGGPAVARVRLSLRRSAVGLLDVAQVVDGLERDAAMQLAASFAP